MVDFGSCPASHSGEAEIERLLAMSLAETDPKRYKEIREALADRGLPCFATKSRAVRDIKQGEFVRFPGDRVVYTREHYVRSERRFCLSRVDGTGDRFVSAEKMLIVDFTY